jgi:hypothetical protein
LRALLAGGARASAKRTDVTDIEDLDLPDCLTLWRCIGCGAMGNAAECTGDCDFQRRFVVDAEVHADLLESYLGLSERRAALGAFAEDVAAATEPAPDTTAEPGRFQEVLAGLRARAKALLAAAPDGPPAAPAPAEERAEIWLCGSCGLVEAQRNCLGICIRRTGDFVQTTDHDRLAAEVAALDRQIGALSVLLRQIAWSTPKPGQAEATRLALRRSALALAA